MKGIISISDNINNYTKLLADLTNLDIVIEDVDKALILLSSQHDEGYETFIRTLINKRISHSYSEVTTALVNLELRRKDKECSSSNTLAEVLAARGSSLNRRRENQQRSNQKLMVDSRKLKKDQCALYKEK